MPAFVRWPGKFAAGKTLNGIVSHQDWLPTLMAAAGEPQIREKVLSGHTAGDRTFRVQIDGLNMLPYLTGEEQESPRKSFFYISDDGQALGGAARRLEDGVHGTAGQAARLLGRALRVSEDPQDVPPAP